MIPLRNTLKLPPVTPNGLIQDLQWRVEALEREVARLRRCIEKLLAAPPREP